MTEIRERDVGQDEAVSVLRDGVRQQVVQSVERLLRRVFRERRELWIESISHLLRDQDFGTAVPSGGEEAAGGVDWLPIASLSQLRKEVGGRFQNLRARWLEAGFPLKAHRGDPSEDYNLDDGGWLEMTSWLLKQGYESRLLDDLNQGYFEIRKRD